MIQFNPRERANVKESLAALQHKIWGHWMRYLFQVSVYNDDGTVTVPADKVVRWQRQSTMTYSQLTEAEKDSDRRIASEVLGALREALLGTEHEPRRQPQSVLL